MAAGAISPAGFAVLVAQSLQKPYPDPLISRDHNPAYLSCMRQRYDFETRSARCSGPTRGVAAGRTLLVRFGSWKDFASGTPSSSSFFRPLLGAADHKLVSYPCNEPDFFLMLRCGSRRLQLVSNGLDHRPTSRQDSGRDCGGLRLVACRQPARRLAWSDHRLERHPGSGYSYGALPRLEPWLRLLNLAALEHRPRSRWCIFRGFADLSPPVRR